MKKKTYTAPWLEVEELRLSNVIMSSTSEDPNYEGGNQVGDDSGSNSVF